MDASSDQSILGGALGGVQRQNISQSGHNVCNSISFMHIHVDEMPYR